MCRCAAQSALDDAEEAAVPLADLEKALIDTSDASGREFAYQSVRVIAVEDKDINRSRMVGNAYASLGDVFAVVESDDGRESARQEVETPYRDLEKEMLLLSVFGDYRRPR